MPCCCAVGCKNRGENGVRMFRFPSDPNRREIWMVKLRRDSWMPTTYSRLCEVHFDSTQFESNRLDGRRLLKPFAIPEIFPHRAVKIARKPPTKRQISYKGKVAEPENNPVEVEDQISLGANMSVECAAGDESSVDPVEHSAEQICGNSDDEKDEVIRRLKSQVSALQNKVKKLESCLEETTRALKCFLRSMGHGSRSAHMRRIV